MRTAAQPAARHIPVTGWVPGASRRNGRPAIRPRSGRSGGRHEGHHRISRPWDAPESGRDIDNPKDHEALLIDAFADQVEEMCMDLYREQLKPRAGLIFGLDNHPARPALNRSPGRLS
jgi:hypothetical protein